MWQTLLARGGPKTSCRDYSATWVFMAEPKESGSTRMSRALNRLMVQGLPLVCCTTAEHTTMTSQTTDLFTTSPTQNAVPVET